MNEIQQVYKSLSFFRHDIALVTNFLHLYNLTDTNLITYKSLLGLYALE